jgi:receptor protein-tyrosine kinase/non-specific protein-tyrosine kinase
MSRIEKALEKAVEIRESIKEVVPEEIITSDNQVALPRFEVGDAVIDPALVDKHIVCITEPHSSAAEQYKKLKARILKATAKDFLNAIMVTSSDIGEGKSITAINLAVAMSNEIDYTVLLVDGDLRNPSIHKYFGIESKYGLGDYLMGRAKLQDVLIKTGIGKLVILPGGEPPENAAELLSSEKMKMLVQEMRLRYKDRYVIFDSSPLLVAADSLSLGSYMEGIIFVIQEGRTSQKAAMQSLSLMKGWNILGVVFNNVSKYLAKNLHPYYCLYGNEKYYKKSKDSVGIAPNRSI